MKASFIGNIDLYGKCILYDDNKDLSVKDYEEIVKMTKSFDFEAREKNGRDV